MTFTDLIRRFYVPTDYIEFRAIYSQVQTITLRGVIDSQATSILERVQDRTFVKAASSSHVLASKVTEASVSRRIQTWRDHKSEAALNFSVNPRSKGGRKEAQVVAVVCVFVDIDGKQPTEALPLLAALPTPSMVVSSGRGTHAYWYLKDRLNRYAGQRLYSAWYAKLKELGIPFDRNACDITRVMRVPGSYHHKAQAYSSIVSITDLAYTTAELVGDVDVLGQGVSDFMRDVADHGYAPTHAHIPLGSTVKNEGRGRGRGEGASPTPTRPHPLRKYSEEEVRSLCDWVGIDEGGRRHALLGKLSWGARYRWGEMEEEALEQVHEFWWENYYRGTTSCRTSLADFKGWYQGCKAATRKVLPEHPGASLVTGKRNASKVVLLNIIYRGCWASTDGKYVANDRHLAKKLGMASHSYVGSYIKWLAGKGLIAYERGLPGEGKPSGVATIYEIPSHYMRRDTKCSTGLSRCA